MPRAVRLMLAAVGMVTSVGARAQDAPPPSAAEPAPTEPAPQVAPPAAEPGASDAAPPAPQPTAQPAPEAAPKPRPKRRAPRRPAPRPLYPYPYPYYPYPYPYPPPYAGPPPYGAPPYASPPAAPSPAELPPREPVPTTRVDPLLPTGISFAGLGALTLVSGIVVAQGGEGELVCAPSSSQGGCLERPNPSREIAAGALLGSGIAMVVFGVPTAIAGRDRIAIDGRRSHGMTTAGVVLTALGAGLVGAGVGALAADASRGNVSSPAVALPLLVVGGVLAATGAPLWGVGSQATSSNVDREAKR